MTRLALVSIGLTIGVAGIAIFSFSSDVFQEIPASNLDAKAVGKSATSTAHMDKADDEPSSVSQPIEPTQFDYPVGSPESVLASYIRANTWQKRLPFIKHTEGLEDRLAHHYGNASLVFDFTRIVAQKQETISVGDVLPVDLVIDSKNLYGQPVSQTITYYLERTPMSYVVLWEPSVGWQPMGWEAFLTSRPIAITELQLRCKLTNNCFSVDTAENVKQTHYELEVEPDNGEFHQPTVAYVAKDSPAGARIFQTLSDGKKHPLVLGIQFREREGEECLWVRYLASDRAYVYDAEMKQQNVSPIEVVQPKSINRHEIQFDVSEISAQWAINRDVLGSQTLIVPEARFRVTTKSSAPITSLRLKMVYLLSRQDSTIEVLYEDTQAIISSGDRPLDHGFSKTVVSRSGKGYMYKPENVAAIAAIIAANAEVEIYYDAGNGFTKFQTIPIAKAIAD